MEEPIITRNPLKSLLQKMLRKQPCLKLPYTTPRAQARRDSFKVGLLGLRIEFSYIGLMYLHKYKINQCMEGTKAETCQNYYMGKTITMHTYLGAKSLSYEGVFQRKKSRPSV